MKDLKTTIQRSNIGGIRWVFISVMNLQRGHQIWCQTPNLVPWKKSRHIYQGSNFPYDSGGTLIC